MARAGLYREQIQLILPGTSESDGVGGWLPAAEGEKLPVWARIRQLKGSQVVALGKEIETQVFQVTTRHRAAYLEAERITWGTRNLKILTRQVDEKSTEITFTGVDGN